MEKVENGQVSLWDSLGQIAKQSRDYDCERYKFVVRELVGIVTSLPLSDKIEAINYAKRQLHEISPFNKEPVDCVEWIKCERVVANDYNPNKVAPPEMTLLEVSIENDGYTQPIVTWANENEQVEVIDGFHRNRVGRESSLIKERIYGYLPVVTVRQQNTDKSNRIASTIRHNRARGKHTVTAMSEIVLELKNRNWKNERIAKELGMDEDEILRLCQITGLESLFSDSDFSKSWNIEDSELDIEFEPLSDDVTDEERERGKYRTLNTDDPERIFHTFDQWECYKAGFYSTTIDGMSKEDGERIYAEFLADEKQFRQALKKVTTEWVKSCEHYLTNKSMNRIAWLGQASVCYAKKIPSDCRAGYHLLTDEQKAKADAIALEFLNKWLKKHKLDVATLEEAQTDLQMQIY